MDSRAGLVQMHKFTDALNCMKKRQWESVKDSFLVKGTENWKVSVVVLGAMPISDWVGQALQPKH